MARMSDVCTNMQVVEHRDNIFIRDALDQDYDNNEWREYKHGNPRRGRAVIANFYSFNEAWATREGSKEDISRLEKTLGENLKFDVITWDLEGVDANEFMKKVEKEAAMKEHWDGDCFVMVIMTHGDKGGKLKAYDKFFRLDKVVDFFTGDNCEALVGKPKIFIIQACRGSKGMSGKILPKSCEKDVPNADEAISEMICLPTHSDIVVAQSQYEGYYSLRNTVDGTYFIQALCDVLDSDFRKPDDRKDDLLQLLTFTSRRVAYLKFTGYKKSDNSWGVQTCQADMWFTLFFNSLFKKPDNDCRHVKQQPTVVSTLLQLLYLRNKVVEKK